MAIGLHLNISYAGTLGDAKIQEMFRTAVTYRDILTRLAEFLEQASEGGGKPCTVQFSIAPTAPVNATATATCASVIAGNTLVIGGTTLTAVANNTAAPTTAQFRIGTSDTECATNICQAINNNATIKGKVYATTAAAVVTIKAKSPGAAGNAITLTSGGGTITVTGSGFLASGAGNDGNPNWTAGGASTVATMQVVPFSTTKGGLVTFVTS